MRLPRPSSSRRLRARSTRFTLSEGTTVHGAEKTGEGTKDAFHGVKEGSEVAVHYTAKGTEETAEEVDNIGKDGLKATEGTVSRMGSGGKTIVVKTADGTEETYHFASHAVGKAGKDIAEGSEKSAKVTVYYTEKAGRKGRALRQKGRGITAIAGGLTSPAAPPSPSKSSPRRRIRCRCLLEFPWRCASRGCPAA